MPIRVLWALELRKHAVGASDEDSCHRWRTDFAVMYACGLREYQAPRSPAHLALPETLCEFRGRIDEALMDALIAIQAAAAMAEGLVSPAHLVVATLPWEQDSHRVTDATTRYKAQKTPWNASKLVPSDPATGPSPGGSQPRGGNRHCKKSCGALAASAGGKATSS